MSLIYILYVTWLGGKKSNYLVEGSFEMMVIFSGVLIEFLWW
jgi:hypothetical protein